MGRRTLVAAGTAIAIAIVAWVWFQHADESAHAPKSVAIALPRMGSRPASVSGRVTRRADGTPIAGAVVVIAKLRATPTDVPATVITTDADGRWVAHDVASGVYVLTASARGFLPAARDDFEVTPGSSADLALEAGGTAVTGTITNGDGVPIARARVTVHASQRELAAITGSDGRYRVDLADGSYRLEATHDDYIAASETVAIEGSARTVDFRLLPGASVRGRVIAGETGEPVADATVLALGPGGHDVTRSDVDGSFAIHHLGGGAVWVRAYGRDYATTDPTMLVLAVGERLDGVELVAERAYTIAGRVVVKGDPKAGLAGAYVMSQSLEGRLPERTGPDGRFEIVGVPAGSHEIIAMLDALSQSVTVQVVDHDVTDMVIELIARAKLSGRVEPPRVAEITLDIDEDIAPDRFEDMESSQMIRATTDPTGGFVLRNVPRGRFLIRALAKDGLAGTLAITSTSADQSNLIVALSPRASIAGRVIDTNGKPVTTGTVWARLEDAPIRLSSSRWAEIGAGGTFKLVGLEPGTYDVTADGVDAKSSVQIVVAPRAERTGVTLTADALDSEIRGQVIGLDGKPATGVVVAANHGEMAMMVGVQRGSTVTDHDGRFVIDKLARGKYVVRAEASRDSGYAAKADVETGSTIMLALAAPGTLVVHVTKSGDAVPDYEIDCHGPAWLQDEVKSADGTHTFSRVVPGDYTCNLPGQSGLITGKVTVSSAATARLELEIPPERFASLTGTVVSVVNGKPLAGLAVAAGGATATTDASGRFVVEHVYAGTGELMVYPHDPVTYHGFEKRPYTAKPDERVDLGTIKIAPPRTGEAGTYGFAVDARDGALRVTSVRPEGPADVAGLKVGDQIDTVDGTAVSTIDGESARRLVMSGNVSIGQTATIGLARGVTVTVTAVKW